MTILPVRDPPSMSYNQLITLAAKDNLIVTHGEALLNWTRQTWESAVVGAVRDLIGVHGELLRQRYPDA